jgi:hypothetical protein
MIKVRLTSFIPKTVAAKWGLALGLVVCGIGTFTTAATAVDLDAAATAFSKSYVHSLSPHVIMGWKGSDSAIKSESAERIVDADTWSALWTRHSPGQQAPSLDFREVMAVVIFFGQQRDGYSASLGKVTYDLTDLDIVVYAFIPDVIRNNIRVNPYLLVVLPRCSDGIRITRDALLSEVDSRWLELAWIPPLAPTGIGEANVPRCV